MKLDWHYQAVRELRDDPEIGQYLTYGIRASRRTMRNWEQIELLHDVTTEGPVAEKLAELFTLHQLSPIHLRDVIEDIFSPK